MVCFRYLPRGKKCECVLVQVNVWLCSICVSCPLCDFPATANEHSTEWVDKQRHILENTITLPFSELFTDADFCMSFFSAQSLYLTHVFSVPSCKVCAFFSSYNVVLLGFFYELPSVQATERMK